MEMLKIVLLVSSDESDIYFANQLIKKLNVVGVIVEKQHGYSRTLRGTVKTLLKYIIKPWLAIKKMNDYWVNLRLKPYLEKARIADEKHFGAERKELFANKNCEVIYTEGIKALNKPDYVDRIRQLQPDVICTCGCSIIKEAILSIPPKGVLNLHGGLSQRYRGVWTTHWAIYNEEPEYIGATVHYVSRGIDDGNIIYQGQPDIVAGDNPESLYAKMVKLGIEMMLKAIDNIQNNTVKSYPLKEKGSLYLDKMMTPDIHRQAWEKTEAGIISRYLEEKDVRDKKVTMMMQEALIE
jgi:folate-dependent phosphoribosylglycinamide formyltransferase PurN